MQNNGLNGLFGYELSFIHSGDDDMVVKPKSDQKDSIGSGENDFSRMLMEEESKAEERKKENTMIDSEKSSKSASEEKDRSSQGDSQPVKKSSNELSPMLQYLYSLMYKNPDAMGLVEKQALGIDGQKYMKDLVLFNKMLSGYDLKLSDLNMDKMGKLAKSGSHAQVNNLLEQISKEKKITEPQVVKRAEIDVEHVKAIGDGKAGVLNTSTDPDALRQALKQEGVNRQEDSRSVMERREVIDQIIKRLDINSFARQTELVMKLNPEYLGDLRMKINMEDGKMKAQFDTTSRRTRDLLDSGLEDLEEVFGKRGLKLESAKVTLVDEME